MPVSQKMHLILSEIGLPFIPGWGELRPFAAELCIIATIIAVLITPFFVRRANRAWGTVAFVGLAVAFVAVLVVGGGPGVVGVHFRGMLVMDRFAMLWKLLLLLFPGGIVLMWFSTSAAAMHEGDGRNFSRS